MSQVDKPQDSTATDRDFQLRKLNLRLAKSVVQTTLENFGYLVFPYGYEQHQSLIHSNQSAEDIKKQLKNAPDFAVRSPEQSRTLLLKVRSTTDKDETKHRPAYNDKLFYYQDQWPNMALIVCCLRTANLYCQSVAKIKAAAIHDLTQDWKTLPQFFKKIDPTDYTLFQQELCKRASLLCESGILPDGETAAAKRLVASNGSYLPTKHKNHATRKGVTLTIVGLKHFESWKNTVWQQQTVPLTMRPSHDLTLQNRYVVEVYGKALGLLPLEETSPVFLGQQIATLTTKGKCIEAHLVGTATEWAMPLADKITAEAIDKAVGGNRNKDRLLQVITPDSLYEWSLRMGKDFGDAEYSDYFPPKYAVYEIEEFIHFLDWLIDAETSPVGSYGDADLEQYIAYEKEQDRLLSEGMADMDARDALQHQYGRGAYVDHNGAIFDGDGEVVGIL